MATLTIGGKTVVTQTGTDEPIMTSNVVMDNVNINNALTSATFPAGHMLRHFYDEYNFNGSPVTITTTASNWSGLQIDIINPNTSNYLFLQMFIPDVYCSGSSNGLGGGFVYSTNSFSSESILGSSAWYFNQHSWTSSGSNLNNTSLTVRVLHPTSSNYSIRPYFQAYSASLTIGQGNSGNKSIATLFAMEIQG